jgi:hypothetical protein
MHLEQASRLSKGHSGNITSMNALSNIDMGKVTRFLVAYPPQPQSANMQKCWAGMGRV